MLRLTEFTVDTLPAAKPLSLVLARTRYEGNFLVAGTAEKPTAIKLDGDHAFACWPSSDASNWSGLIVLSVAIEVDPSSIVDTNAGSAPLGALSRRGESLCLYSMVNNGFRLSQVVPVLDGVLPPVGKDQSVAFARWQIVLGEGLDKRVLWTVDVMPKAEA